MPQRRFKPLQIENLEGEDRRIAEEILKDRKSLDGPFAGMLLSPRLGDRLQRVGAYIRFESKMPGHLRELAILLTARKWNAQFEWYAHRIVAEQAGLAPSICDDIANGREPQNLSADEAAVRRFALSLLATGCVDDDIYADAASRFGEEGVAELIGTVGYYTTASFFLNVDRFPIPDDATPLPDLPAKVQAH